MSYPPLHNPPPGHLPNPNPLPYVVSQFENDLAELKDASRPVLNHLTNMAKEHIRYYREIVDVVCARIMRLPAPMVLPTFYLLDSITKNVGGVYLEGFARKVSPIFLECFERAPAALRVKLSQMLRTWVPYFGKSLVDYLYEEVLRIERTIPPPPPPEPHNTIHVNPNFFPRADNPRLSFNPVIFSLFLIFCLWIYFRTSPSSLPSTDFVPSSCCSTSSTLPSTPSINGNGNPSSSFS